MSLDNLTLLCTVSLNTTSLLGWCSIATFIITRIAKYSSLRAALYWGNSTPLWDLSLFVYTRSASFSLFVISLFYFLSLFPATTLLDFNTSSFTGSGRYAFFTEHRPEEFDAESIGGLAPDSSAVVGDGHT